MKSLRMGLAAIALAAASFTQPASAEDRTIRLGQVGLSFYAVVGAIVQEVLEQDGYRVGVKTVGVAR